MFYRLFTDCLLQPGSHKVHIRLLVDMCVSEDSVNLWVLSPLIFPFQMYLLKKKKLDCFFHRVFQKIRVCGRGRLHQGGGVHTFLCILNFLETRC